MKTQLLILMALAGASAFAQPRFSIGVNIGGYPGYGPGGYYFAAPLPPPPVYYYPPLPPPVYYAPPRPVPGFVWGSGYYYPVRRGYSWYGTLGPNAVWIGPRYWTNRYFGGYWR